MVDGGGVVECDNGFVGFDLQEGVKEGEEGVEDVVEDGVIEEDGGELEDGEVEEGVVEEGVKEEEVSVEEGVVEGVDV